MFTLAVPVVLAELAWIGMSIADTVMVGRVGAVALGAVGLGGILFFSFAIFGMGLLLGLDTLVAQAYGARRLGDCHRALLHGVYLSLILAPLLMALIWTGARYLPLLGVHPSILPDTRLYLNAITWSTPPLLLYAAFRRYLQAINAVRAVMFALVSANLINVFANWVLIFGKFGAPQMGAEGAGWATCWSRLYMAAVLVVYTVFHNRHHDLGLFRISFRPDLALFRRLLALGLPASMHLLAEVGAFGIATALAARLNPVALAAHQIALNAASATFMVPLGVASAAAVRVGHAIGRKDPHAAARSGWTALVFGVGFMGLAGIAFLLFPEAIFRVFTTDPSVAAAGVAVLFIAALFQLFDGTQVVCTGALRGAGDTHSAMMANFAGYYILGLPLGYSLCFLSGRGLVGLWTGLSAGLIAVALVLLFVWTRTMRRKAAAVSTQPPSA